MAKTPPAAKKGMPSTTAKPGSKTPSPSLSATALASLQHRTHAAKSKLRDKVGIGPKKAQPKPHAATKRTATTKTEPFVRGKDVLTKEQSLVRAEALEKLLDDSRRGAKVTLWRDFLGSSLPFWGNVRRGTAMFRDDLATNAEQALGLPDGWLDNPSFPPKSVTAWLNDPNVPLPVPAKTDGAAAGKATPGTAAGAAQPAAKAAAHKPAPSLQGAPMPRLPGAGAGAAAAAAAAPAAEPGVSESPVPAKRLKRTPPASAQQASAVAEPASTPVAPAAAPASVSAAPAPAPASVGAAPARAFTWQPVAQPKSVGAPGPLTQALSGVLTELALEGRFTDDDALRLINFLKSAG